MAWDGDPRVALFVLEEDARGRDPAETLADGVQKARRRAIATAPVPAEAPLAPEPPAQPLPGAAAGYDPLQAMVHRSAARLREMVRIEAAVRLAAEHGTATSEAAPAATAAAAHAALAHRRAELRRPSLPLRDGLRFDPVTGDPTSHDPAPANTASPPARPHRRPGRFPAFFRPDAPRIGPPAAPCPMPRHGS
jgi:hypothetical protein